MLLFDGKKTNGAQFISLESLKIGHQPYKGLGVSAGVTEG
jgi:hypothetical protein